MKTKISGKKHEIGKKVLKKSKNTDVINVLCLASLRLRLKLKLTK